MSGFRKTALNIDDLLSPRHWSDFYKLIGQWKGTWKFPSIEQLGAYSIESNADSRHTETYRPERAIQTLGKEKESKLKDTDFVGDCNFSIVIATQAAGCLNLKGPFISLWKLGAGKWPMRRKRVRSTHWTGYIEHATWNTKLQQNSVYGGPRQSGLHHGKLWIT